MTLNPVAEADIEQEKGVTVVYRDGHVLALNKPSGMPSVPLREGERDTACEAALRADPSLASVGRGGFEPGILHRLDTGTSGLLVFARTQEAFDELQAQWKARNVTKRYRAVCGLDPKRAEQARGLLEAPGRLPARINTPLGHHPKSARKMIALVNASRKCRGKPLTAVSWLRSASPLGSGLWDVTVDIETGVMHQIRVHLASLGLPLLGDSLYGGAPSTRLWLHAWRLGLTLRGLRLTLQSALPKGWPTAVLSVFLLLGAQASQAGQADKTARVTRPRAENSCSRALTPMLSWDRHRNLAELGKLLEAETSGGDPHPKDQDIITEYDQQHCATLPNNKNITTQTINPRTTALTDNGSVWRAGTNRWTEEEENLYSEWVKKVPLDLFEKISLPTDCADAAIFLRVIFARIRHLPVYFPRDGKPPLTNSSTEFEGKRTTSWSPRRPLENPPVMATQNPPVGQDDLGLLSLICSYGQGARRLP